MSKKRPFPDWKRHRPFKEWYKEASNKQKNVLDTSGLHLEYFMKGDMKMSWSRFNRLVGRAVKMLNHKVEDFDSLLKWAKKDRENKDD